MMGQSGLGALTGRFRPTEAEAARIAWRWMAALLILRIGLAYFATLGVDENYEVAVGREFSLSFYDHPPLVFWLAVLPAWLTGIEHGFIYRLPPVILGTGTIWLVWDLARRMGGGLAGLWAIAFLAASPIIVIGIGVFAGPDMPLGFFSMLVAWILWHIHAAGDRAPVGLWLAAGAALGGALMSKYQAGLIPIALLVYMLATMRGRRWLVQPGPWLGACVGLIGLLPVAIWNLQNDWASFAFHTGRTGDGLQPLNFVNMALVQAVYLVFPVILLLLAGIVRGLRGQLGDAGRSLALMALGPVLMFNLIYLFSKNSLPHWTMPGWVFAIPLGAMLLARLRSRALAWFALGTAVASFVLWALILTFLVHINNGIVTRYFYDTPPKWDWTVDAFDWRGLEPALEARGLLAETDLLVSDHWIRAGEMSTALKGRFPLRPIGGRVHHFAHMEGAKATGRALFLRPEHLRGYERTARITLDLARTVDPQAELLEPVTLKRGPQDYVKVIVIRLNVAQ